MKTLTEQYHELETRVFDTYNKLVENTEYDLLKPIILRDYDSTAQEILKEIDAEGVENVAQEYDFLEGCEQIYYNDRRGVERMAYLLGASKKEGIFIFDNDNWNTAFINFSDLNGVLTKINVIEEIQNLTKL